MAHMRRPEMDYHAFRPTQMKSVCAICGFGVDSPEHIDVIDDSPEARELSSRLAVEQENQNHDADVILKFQLWIGKLGSGYISKADLIKLIEGYAQAVKLGHH